MVERLDKAKLLYTGKVVVDRDDGMLVPPDSVARFNGAGFTVAKEPPQIEFGIIPVEPLFLNESPVKPVVETKWYGAVSNNEPGPWSNWCQANFDTRTGKFYSAVGDHGKYDAHILLVEYDPAAKKMRCLPEVNNVLGRTKTSSRKARSTAGWTSTRART